MQLNKEEAQVVLALTEKVNITGRDARTVAYIQNKLETFLKEQTEEAPKEKKGK